MTLREAALDRQRRDAGSRPKRLSKEWPGSLEVARWQAPHVFGLEVLDHADSAPVSMYVTGKRDSHLTMTPSAPDPIASVVLTASAYPASHVVTFRRVELDKKQARLKDRYGLVPEIDLSVYTCRAVIDWLDLRIRTAAATQWKWVKKEIEDTIGGNPWVVDVPDEDQARGQSFRIRFQEPELGLIMKAMVAIDARWTLTDRPELVGLEISIDMTPRVYSEESLASIFAVIARTHLPSRDVIAEPTDRPRFVANDSVGAGVTKHVLPLRKDNRGIDDQLLTETGKDVAATTDSTYYAGAKDSPLAWRLMTKRIDQQNKATGTVRELPDDEIRVRLEVTILEPELASVELHKLDDLVGFSFQTLQGSYFRFRLPTFKIAEAAGRPHLVAVRQELERKRLAKFLTAGVVGLEAMDAARKRIVKTMRKRSRTDRTDRNPPRRLRSSMTSYEELTKKVAQALRHLGERQRKSVKKHFGTSSSPSY